MPACRVVVAIILVAAAIQASGKVVVRIARDGTTADCSSVAVKYNVSHDFDESRRLAAVAASARITQVNRTVELPVPKEFGIWSPGGKISGPKQCILTTIVGVANGTMQFDYYNDTDVGLRIARWGCDPIFCITLGWSPNQCSLQNETGGGHCNALTAMLQESFVDPGNILVSFYVAYSYYRQTTNATLGDAPGETVGVGLESLPNGGTPILVTLYCNSEATGGFKLPSALLAQSIATFSAFERGYPMNLTFPEYRVEKNTTADTGLRSPVAIVVGLVAGLVALGVAARAMVMAREALSKANLALELVRDLSEVVSDLAKQTKFQFANVYADLRLLQVQVENNYNELSRNIVEGDIQTTAITSSLLSATNSFQEISTLRTNAAWANILDLEVAAMIDPRPGSVDRVLAYAYAAAASTGLPAGYRFGSGVGAASGFAGIAGETEKFLYMDSDGVTPWLTYLLPICRGPAKSVYKVAVVSETFYDRNGLWANPRVPRDVGSCVSDGVSDGLGGWYTPVGLGAGMGDNGGRAGTPKAWRASHIGGPRMNLSACAGFLAETTLAESGPFFTGDDSSLSSGFMTSEGGGQMGPTTSLPYARLTEVAPCAHTAVAFGGANIAFRDLTTGSTPALTASEALLFIPPNGAVSVLVSYPAATGWSSENYTLNCSSGQVIEGYAQGSVVPVVYGDLVALSKSVVVPFSVAGYDFDFRVSIDTTLEGFNGTTFDQIINRTDAIAKKADDAISGDGTCSMFDFGPCSDATKFGYAVVWLIGIGAIALSAVSCVKSGCKSSTRSGGKSGNYVSLPPAIALILAVGCLAPYTSAGFVCGGVCAPGPAWPLCVSSPIPSGVCGVPCAEFDCCPPGGRVSVCEVTKEVAPSRELATTTGRTAANHAQEPSTTTRPLDDPAKTASTPAPVGSSGFGTTSKRTTETFSESGLAGGASASTAGTGGGRGKLGASSGLVVGMLLVGVLVGLAVAGAMAFVRGRRATGQPRPHALGVGSVGPIYDNAGPVERRWVDPIYEVPLPGIVKAAVAGALVSGADACFPSGPASNGMAFWATLAMFVPAVAAQTTSQLASVTVSINTTTTTPRALTTPTAGLLCGYPEQVWGLWTNYSDAIEFNSSGSCCIVPKRAAVPTDPSTNDTHWEKFYTFLFYMAFFASMVVIVTRLLGWFKILGGRVDRKIRNLTTNVIVSGYKAASGPTYSVTGRIGSQPVRGRAYRIETPYGPKLGIWSRTPVESVGQPGANFKVFGMEGYVWAPEATANWKCDADDQMTKECDVVTEREVISEGYVPYLRLSRMGEATLLDEVARNTTPPPRLVTGSGARGWGKSAMALGVLSMASGADAMIFRESCKPMATDCCRSSEKDTMDILSWFIILACFLMAEVAFANIVLSKRVLIRKLSWLRLGIAASLVGGASASMPVGFALTWESETGCDLGHMSRCSIGQNLMYAVVVVLGLMGIWYTVKLLGMLYSGVRWLMGRCIRQEEKVRGAVDAMQNFQSVMDFIVNAAKESAGKKGIG